MLHNQDTWNVKPRSNFHEGCENIRVKEGHFGKKCDFYNTPVEKWSETVCTLKLSEEPNFYNLG